MTTIIFSDPMIDIRYWLRNDPTLQPLHNGRVFFRMPDRPVAPLMLIRNMAGGPALDSEVPNETLQVMVESFGLQNADYQAVRQLDAALKSVAQSWWKQTNTTINPTGNSRLVAANYLTGYDSPDPDTGWPRRVAHLQLTIYPLAPLTF
jgi:hypothetical protein